jgi:hypothetical protein
VRQSLIPNPFRPRLPDSLLRLLLCSAQLRRYRTCFQSLDIFDRPVEIAARLRGLQASALGVVVLELGVGMLLGQLMRDGARA